jgi:dipeptidyl aminopeptidase/acylaminoacyl peptidase
MNDHNLIKTQHEFVSNGITLRASSTRIKKESGKSEKAVVLMATGDGRKGSQSSSWAPLTTAVLQSGAAVFIFDFQGLGLSDGTHSELTISAGVTNLRDAVFTLRRLEWAAGAKIGGLGSSFGACAMLILQGLESPFHVLGLKSPASFLPEAYENEHGEEGMQSWAKTGTSDVTGYSYATYLDSFKHNIYAYSRTISCPTMIVHGSADTIVPISQSFRLARALPNCIALHVLNGVNHDYKQPGALETLAAHQKAFFSKYLMDIRDHYE